MTTLPQWTHELVLLVTSVDPVPDDSEITPGPWMAILVLGLAVASTLLWFSMRRHLRRIRVPHADGRAPDGSEDGGPAAGEVHHDRPADPPLS